MGEVILLGQQTNNKPKLSETNPKLSAFLGLAVIALFVFGVVSIVGDVIETIVKSVLWLKETVSSLDAVIIVALISGAVSIIGIVLSSIVSKMVDYKKARREYLAQKREQPYSEFIEMIYKLQQSSKPGKAYPQEEMVEDLLRFSKQITLWGSPRVVNNWVKFKEIAINGNTGIENLLITEELMNDMRRDLGLRRTQKGKLLAFFINDIKDAMKKAKK